MFKHISARIEHIYISQGHNFFGRHDSPPCQHPISEVDEVFCVTGCGLMGDRFFNYKSNYKGQVTFFAMEVYDDLCQKLGISNRPPSALRRNILMRGIDLNSLIGHSFVLQGITFEGTEECHPCYWMDQALAPGAEDLLKGRGGLRARILSDGFLRITGARSRQDAATTRHG
jgi:MOSC domain-containing protein YiiM